MIAKADAATGAEVAFMVWCRSGKHRSVAVANMAVAVLRRSGFQVTRLFCR